MEFIERDVALAIPLYLISPVLQHSKRLIELTSSSQDFLSEVCIAQLVYLGLGVRFVPPITVHDVTESVAHPKLQRRIITPCGCRACNWTLLNSVPSDLQR